MNDTDGSIGAFLRRERERRGITLKTISEQTKVSVSLLEGLEGDDISRWPGGIFRRAFVRAYAASIGLDPDDVVRRFEQQHQPPPEEGLETMGSEQPSAPEAPAAPLSGTRTPEVDRSPRRVRLLATAADLTVAVVLGLGSAAAGSRMLWPVLLISAYYGLGTALTGQTPMMTLLGEEGAGGVEKRSVPLPAAKPAVRKGRHENGGREARHDGSSRRHGRMAGGAVRH